MLLKANYHTHTKRCGHASGEDREYVEKAIEHGIKVLGFSDHSPMIYATPGYVSGSRMALTEIDDYCRSITELKREYRDDIEIRLGFEAEYYPETHERYMEFLSAYPVEYLILGQHCIDREENKEASLAPSDDPGRMRRYYKNVLDGLKTGHYLYAAHPDIIFFSGDEAVYEEETLKFLTEVKKLGVPLELNRLGFSEERHYPYAPFWHLAGQVGNRAVIGVDAHSPAQFDDAAAVEGLRKLAEASGVEILDELVL